MQHPITLHPANHQPLAGGVVTACSYNVIFTVLTPFVIGAFDRDLDKETSMQYPIIYRQGESAGFLNHVNP